jgi:hypothetical protein
VQAALASAGAWSVMFWGAVTAGTGAVFGSAG